MAPLLTSRVRLSQHCARGTSLAIIMFAAPAGVAGYSCAGNIDWRLDARRPRRDDLLKLAHDAPPVGYRRDVSMEAADKRRDLAEVARRVATCRDCPLAAGRTHTVPGEGSPDAEIMFIGEGPGYYEDQQGRPFVGASGKFLDELLALIGLDRRKVFIGNVVKCRPPNNRDPQPEEIEACRKHLDAQIGIIQPKVIVTLGRHSMQRYFPGEAISRIHGQPRRTKDQQIIVPMYHPAAALHQGNLRKVIESDFRRLPEFLARALGTAPVGVTAAPSVPSHLRAAPAQAPKSSDQMAEGEQEPEPQQMRLL